MKTFCTHLNAIDKSDGIIKKLDEKTLKEINLNLN